MAASPYDNYPASAPGQPVLLTDQYGNQVYGYTQPVADYTRIDPAYGYEAGGVIHEQGSMSNKERSLLQKCTKVAGSLAVLYGVYKVGTGGDVFVQGPADIQWTYHHIKNAYDTLTTPARWLGKL